MARVLVTGGAGFLGSHLCDRLVARGDEVVCLDDFSTGSEANLDRARPELLRHDVAEPFDIAGPLDRIYHLAAPASPRDYQRDPIRTSRTIVRGADHALELAERRGARILLASTSEVYGDPEVHPQPESYAGRVQPHGPRSCYDEGKRMAESLCFDFHRQRGVAIRVARIFNTYGPRMRPDDGRVVPGFLAAARRGEPLLLHGDGTQTRSFCYVDDLVAGLVRLMESDEPGPVNLGNPEETTIADLARRILTLTDSHSRIETAPRPVHDPARRRPDITLARTRLDWNPAVPLDEGLRRTIEETPDGT